jgi:hypothetical protein
MSTRRDYACTTTFLDLLFNMLLAFVAMFVMSFALMNVAKKEDGMKQTAEFIITLEWDKESDDDLDIWVEDPEGRLVFFKRPQDGLMHLDRDDYGRSNDLIKTDEGIVQVFENKESVSIRGIIPGEYVVNVHAYNKRDKQPTTAIVKVEKLKPVGTVAIRTISVESSGEETTAIRFTVDKTGKVTGTNDLPKSLLNSIPQDQEQPILPTPRQPQ